MIIPNQIVAVADVPNKNGRIYPRAVLERLVVEYAGKNGLGMLGSPELPGVDNPHDIKSYQIDLDKVGFKWENLRLDGDNLLADIMPIPKLVMGELLIEAKDHLAFRTVGHATINKDGIVGDDYKLFGLSALAKDQAP